MATQQKPYKGMAMEGVIATWYTRNTGHDRRRFEAAAQAAAERVLPGGTVLEVAPGPGYLAIAIAQSGRLVTTLDTSKSFVKIAQENANRVGVAVDVRQGNAAAMPFADASFDYVVCMAAITGRLLPRFDNLSILQVAIELNQLLYRQLLGPDGVRQQQAVEFKLQACARIGPVQVVEQILPFLFKASLHKL